MWWIVTRIRSGLPWVEETSTFWRSSKLTVFTMEEVSKEVSAAAFWFMVEGDCYGRKKIVRRREARKQSREGIARLLTIVQRLFLCLCFAFSLFEIEFCENDARGRWSCCFAIAILSQVGFVEIARDDFARYASSC